MNEDASRAHPADSRFEPLPPWSECDVFCIHDYAGTGKSPCGWRGRLYGARRDREAKLLCPRCGCATLFQIPRKVTLKRGEDQHGG